MGNTVFVFLIKKNVAFHRKSNVMKTNGSVVSKINTEVNNSTQKCENLTDTDNDMQYMIMLQISHICFYKL
jgi:predicted RNA binding protein with dsRBD fold (UPF0201 family)